MDGLTPQQERFCQEYMIDLNATQAAIRSGYASETARQQGSRLLLTNANVQNRISELQKRREKKTEIKAEKVLAEIARIAFHDVRTLFDDEGRLQQPKQWDDDTAASIASFEAESAPDGEARIYKVKRYDKGRFLELLCRHLGILNDTLTIQKKKSKVDLEALSDEQRKQLADVLRAAITGRH